MTGSPPTARTPGLTALPPRTVEFRGARGGQAALTWGQQGIWRSTQWLDDGDPYFNLPWALPVTGAADLDAVLRAVGRLVERHETLRTAYVREGARPGTGTQGSAGAGTEAGAGAGTVQRVRREGRLTVGVYEAAAKPMTAAKALAAELASTGFDYAAELPVRCAVVCLRGRPRALALALSHLALDGWSLNMVAAEWPRLVAGEDLPVPEWQPLDQAAFERSDPPPGAQALRHWRSGLAAAPRSMFDFPEREPEEPRFVRYGMDSPAAAVAAEALAARHGVTTSSVLTVASAALLAAVTGHSTAALQLIVSNRHHLRTGAMAGPAAQDGLCVIDLGAGDPGRVDPVARTFAEALGPGHRRTMATYRNGHYDPSLVLAARDAEAWNRGADIDLDAFFNDVRQGGRWSGLPDVDPGDAAALAALRGRSRTFFVGAYSKVKAKIFFATGPAPSTCEFFVLVDTAFLPGRVAERMLGGLEELLVRVVSADVPLDRVAEVAGLEPVRRPAGWTRIGPDWVNLPETEALLRRVCAPGPAAVAVEPGSDGPPRLTGYLVARPGLDTPDAVHAAVMRAAAGRTGVLAPRHYVLCPAPPAGPSGWPDCPRLMEGGGRVPASAMTALGR
ncbi:condensation domain-containing protein [Microbispora sp. H10885]|uniref:condensation domain-containing protein n=1 Tax=Microbispora sp. H10885 TaxID=2729110 RepID=UPI0016045107|nr:condensation domain-containing protein [Microbispora sp. H10885]